MPVASGFQKPFEKVMVFIDGGYIRKLCVEHCGSNDINFEQLLYRIIIAFDHHPNNRFQANLIRAYYYDAVVDESDPDYCKQRAYFDPIPEKDFYTVRLGKAVRSTTKGLKQKGVDILMSVDAVTKAYQNQYDTAIFLLGDADFIPLIESVKDAGKKTMLVYNKAHSSKQLVNCSDMHMFIADTEVKLFMNQPAKT
jgi:uncharacterized LabA/DUF88 family protein